MKFIVDHSCGNSTKALYMIDYIKSMSDDRLKEIYKGKILHIKTVITHGKHAVCMCQLEREDMIDYALYVEFVSAGKKDIANIEIYKKSL